MSWQTRVKLLRWTVVACTLLSFQSSSLNAQENKQGDVKERNLVQWQFRGKPISRSGYWIGIWAREIDEQLAEKLDVKVGSGIAVGQVVPGSPAAKAELATGDLILSVDEKPVSTAQALAKLVGDSEGKALEFQIQRAGKKQTINITPDTYGQKPKEDTREAVQRILADSKASKEKLEALLRQIEARQKHMQATRGARGVGGQAQPWQRLVVPSPTALPDDMEVTIKKRGKQPAKVIVKQGEKMWKTTENELGMLPVAAQGYVARMLGRPMAQGAAGFSISGAQPGAPGARVQIRIGEDDKPPVITPRSNVEYKALPGGGYRIEYKELAAPKEQQTEKSVDKEKE